MEAACGDLPRAIPDSIGCHIGSGARRLRFASSARRRRPAVESNTKRRLLGAPTQCNEAC